MRGTRSVPLIFCFSPFEFEQRLLILNRQQPAGRLTAMFVPRSLRRGQTCATGGATAETVGLFALLAGQGVVGSMSIPVQARAGEP